MNAHISSIVNKSTGVVYLSVPEMISFLNDLKKEETEKGRIDMLDELILAFATMKGKYSE
jgi:hypothetical protein